MTAGENMAEIILDKNKLMVDEAININVLTSEPEQQVRISMELADEDGKMFRSCAEFISDKSGRIDLDTAKPLNGTYEHADGTGLFWSMVRKDTRQDDYFIKKTDEDMEATIYVTGDDEILAAEKVTLQFKGEGIEALEIEPPELKGNLYSPSEQGTYPSVMILGGSDGGNTAHAAAYLAGKGYLVLSLSYFNDEGLNEHLENVDLNYFKQAAGYLSNHEKSDGKVNLIGYSKGAELALLLGETFNSYQTIIAGAGSNYATSGMKGGIFAPVSGWTLDGEALPYLKMKFPVSFMFSTIRNYIKKRPFYFLDVWKKSLSGKKAADHKIDVSGIEAPLLIISGGEDKLWPSTSFSREIKKERDNKADRYLDYPGAGHFISFPYSFNQMPANVLMNVDGMIIDFGGTKRENAYAAEESLEEILRFLERNN